MNTMCSNTSTFHSIYLLLLSIAIISIAVFLASVTEYENKHEKRYYAYATATATLPDFNFAAAGDWGCNSNTNKTIMSMQSKNPELVLGLGDYSYKKTAVCWLQMIDPIDEKMKIVIGNHESEPLSLLNRYMSHFNLTKQYYSFDYQNVHFIAMSTELPWTKSSAQYKFVKDDLLKASIDPNTEWIVVYFHKQMYTIPSDNFPYPTLRSTYHPLFEQYGVDLVLQAHNHNYQRTYPIKFNNTGPRHPIETSINTSTYTDPDGQIFATVGTGGVYLHPFTDKKETEKDYYVTQYLGYGILNIDITNNGRTLTGKFYANNNGRIIDQFTIIK
jgi:predicted MPP superfamily phosphohydrolase